MIHKILIWIIKILIKVFKILKIYILKVIKKVHNKKIIIINNKQKY
jgi:hypothetical protein